MTVYDLKLAACRHRDKASAHKLAGDCHRATLETDAAVTLIAAARALEALS